MRVDIGGGVGDGAIARILRIEDAQRVLVEAGEAVLGPITTVRLAMRAQRRAPCPARFGVAQGAETQPPAAGPAALRVPLDGGRSHLTVRGGLGGGESRGRQE